jgi:hypothetical protein
MRMRGYLNRIASAYGINFGKDSEGITKWRQLAGIEVAEYTPMDKRYFEAHAKKDYEAFVKSNPSAKTGVAERFICQNSELVAPQTYFHRISVAFNLDPVKRSLSLSKWQKLAKIEVIKYEEMDQKYFKNNAKNDYEIAFGSKSPSSTAGNFTFSNQETISVQTYFRRITVIFG